MSHIFYHTTNKLSLAGQQSVQLSPLLTKSTQDEYNDKDICMISYFLYHKLYSFCVPSRDRNVSVSLKQDLNMSHQQTNCPPRPDIFHHQADFLTYGQQGGG